ncbi:hypothetical protein HF086_002692 [Spodoptera exigua]|uniref:Protein lin-37 homolog n=1 Tax=Spodoptera exigua TaxID=7107 RepID=A0A922SCT1_SPOEX|nr:hypothetical protein HF086_002692 [Spodoptera exigua]
MPKRRRLFTPLKIRTAKSPHSSDVREVATARGRLKGALMDVLDPTADESDASSDYAPEKRDSQEYRSDDEDRYKRKRSPHRQSYVLKLFDRSVDLSQFSEESPLYPICRAWIVNQPRANYSALGKKEETESQSETLELPGPEGPHREAPPPTKEQLLASHSSRWVAVRRAWLDQAAKVEARYENTQQVLNKINVKYVSALYLH